MDDKVIKFPAALERHAQAIRVAITHRGEGRESWIKATLELSVELAGAKAKFSKNEDFGEWCRDSGFGDNVISKNQRPILVQWGEKPDWTRTVLEKTERMSIETIHAKEWAITSPRNSPKEYVKPPGGVQREKALAYVQVYEAEHSKLPSEIEINRDTGVSRGTGADVLRDIKSKRSSDDVQVTYIKAQDKHVEARVRMLSKKLEDDFAERVRLQVLEENKEYRETLNRLQTEASAKWERYDSLVNSHKPIFTETEFMTILACLHPDNSASKEKRDTAFRAFNAMKFQLTGKK